VSGRTSVALSFLAQMDPGWKGLLLDRCRKYIRSRVRGSHWRRSDATPLGALRSRAKHASNEKHVTSFCPRNISCPPLRKKGLHGGGFGPLPRSEVNGLSEAVTGLLRPEAIAPRCAEPQRRVRQKQETFEAQYRHTSTPVFDLRTLPSRGQG